MDSSKRTILITGCSDGGLGSSIALAFYQAGWRVFASARNISKLKQAQAAGIEIVQLDTISEESIASSVSQIEKLTGGSLDALLNNAGAGLSMPLMDLDISKTSQLFELNVFSLISTTRGFLPLLIKSSHGALVINNTSCASLPSGSLPFSGAYSASKAAATSLTETLRLELAPLGIKVVNLMTGGVNSNFHENAPPSSLPASSMYNVAKEAVEKAIAREQDKPDAGKWARKVAASLSRPKPPHWIWGGKYSTLVWITSFLPIGIMDGTLKKMSGLDVVERSLKELGKTKE